jgi:putative alpha-1,2-mannosidase
LPSRNIPLVIEAAGAAKGKIFVKALHINGEPINSPIIDHKQIVAGGTFHFDMESSAQVWGSVLNLKKALGHEEL